MKRTDRYTAHDVTHLDQPDGSILLTSNTPLGPVARTTADWLHRWAQEAPHRSFVAERSGAGWRAESYAETLQKVQAIAAALLGRGLNARTPILILSGNGVDHALLSLAAHYVGIPTVPLAEQYALIPAAHDRLRAAVQMVRPAMAFVEDAGQFDAALRLEIFEDIELVASRAGTVKTTAFDTLLAGDSGVDLAGAHAQVSPDTVAKILMTSGSTSAPKGVLTTQRMLCTNQAQVAGALPFLQDRPPRILDWLPWNHTFGGSHNFNLMLSNGGSLYVDGGKPAPGLFDKTLENLALVTGTLSFNVPVGFQMLLEALRADAALRQRFFEDLDLIFYAGASLPQEVWEGFEAMALDIKGYVPLMTSSWGLTETAPATLMQQEPADTSGVVGVPLAGVTIKLVPLDGLRHEVRTKGDNNMPGYFDAPEQTAAAFDDDGFFITGDAMCLVDSGDVNKGLRFDGRISEDFKLLTGTRVHAAQLRLDLLARLAPLAADLVITGADRSEIGALIFPNMAALKAAGLDGQGGNGVHDAPELLREIKRRLAAQAQEAGSATRVARALVLSVPASMPDGEMTAKGNLNFRRILTRRADMLERLYAEDDPAVVTL